MSAPRWLVGGNATLVVAAGTATVWLVDLDDRGARERAQALALLPGEAASVAERRDAGERLLRRRLARLLLAAAGGCRPDEVILGRTGAGAPLVDRPAGWQLSLAARWPLCAIGVARRPIGVDVEAVGEPLPDDLLTAGESGTPGQARGDELRRAAGQWAAKEAHAKWTRRPRDLDPATIETGRPPLVTSRFGVTRCWLHDLDTHVAAVCAAA